jgi:hypothetical protein
VIYYQRFFSKIFKVWKLVFAANQFGPRFDSVLDLKFWLGPACQPPSLIPLVRRCSALPKPLPCRCTLPPPLAALRCRAVDAQLHTQSSKAWPSRPPRRNTPSHCLAAAASTSKRTHSKYSCWAKTSPRWSRHRMLSRPPLFLFSPISVQASSPFRHSRQIELHGGRHLHHRSTPTKA